MSDRIAGIDVTGRVSSPLPQSIITTGSCKHTIARLETPGASPTAKWRTSSRPGACGLSYHQRPRIIEIVLRRLQEREARTIAAEAHRNEQAIARTRLRYSGRPIFDADGNAHFLD